MLYSASCRKICIQYMQLRSNIKKKIYFSWYFYKFILNCFNGKDWSISQFDYCESFFVCLTIAVFLICHQARIFSQKFSFLFPFDHYKYLLLNFSFNTSPSKSFRSWTILPHHVISLHILTCVFSYS